ncbi:Cytochrome P450 [Mycena venus]|uniref:Cytochrome P450 n=1 Tax=Mycena venus TaxID=2733690 RepID=A0A8H6X8N5_9AGAR|nr:Cytochrome P450 [Mycena venus]
MLIFCSRRRQVIDLRKTPLSLMQIELPPAGSYKGTGWCHHSTTHELRTEMLTTGLASYGVDYATIFVVAGLAIYFALYRRNNLRDIPGPPSSSWIFGNMLQLMLPPQYGDHEFTWLTEFGPVYLIKGCFGQNRLMVSDPLALQYILNSPHFGHGPNLENAINLMFDQNAIMAAKGETHKRLRAALNIGFTSSAVRNYQPIFERVAEKITERLDKCSGSLTDLYPILSPATLSAISEAVLGCSTRDLGEEFVANNEHVMRISSSQSSTQIIADAIASRLPKMVWGAAANLPTATFKVLRAVKSLARQIGRQAVADKLAAIQQGANTRTDVFGMLLDPEQSDMKKNVLTEDELVAQTGILMIDIQNSNINYAQKSMRHSVVQPALFSHESMPLLNAFIKAWLKLSMGLYPPGVLPERIAVQDTVIPLTNGIKTSTGEVMNHIPVQKGQVVHVAIASYQRLQSRWGEDAHRFRPSRWIDGTVVQGQAVAFSVVHGWRFAILEMQVFFSELVGTFSFALPGDHCLRTLNANSLILVAPSGEKAAPLYITRI